MRQGGPAAHGCFMLPTIRTIRQLIHERLNENDRIDPIGAAGHRPLRCREFTQELPRKLLPTRAKARQSQRVASSSSASRPIGDEHTSRSWSPEGVLAKHRHRTRSSETVLSLINQLLGAAPA